MVGLIIVHSHSQFPSQFVLGGRTLREFLTLKLRMDILISSQHLLLVRSVYGYTFVFLSICLGILVGYAEIRINL